jgi:cation transport ATPase
MECKRMDMLYLGADGVGDDEEEEQEQQQEEQQQEQGRRRRRKRMMRLTTTTMMMMMMMMMIMLAGTCTVITSPPPASKSSSDCDFIVEPEEDGRDYLSPILLTIGGVHVKPKFENSRQPIMVCPSPLSFPPLRHRSCIQHQVVW